MHKLLRKIVSLSTIVSCVAVTTAQMPTPAAQTPVPMTALGAPAVPADPSAADPAAQSLEPVRQAIARQDYPAAQAALDNAKRANPNSPNIAMYQSLIQRGQVQGVVASPEPATPPPVDVTPAFTPASPDYSNAELDPSSANESPADESIVEKAKELWENEMVRYGLLGALALIIIFVIYSILKKRRNHSEEASYDSNYGSVSTNPMGINGDQPEDLGLYSTGDDLSGGELASSSPSMDFPPPDYTSGAAGGTALSGGMEGYSVPTFDTFEEEEEEQAAPPPRPAPVKPVDEDAMINIFADDEPAPTGQDTAESVEPATAEPLGSDSMGMDFNPTKQTPLSHFPSEETVILSAPDVEPQTLSPSRNATPASSPSLSSGTVDLEDIFGSQPLPGQDASPNLLDKPYSDAAIESPSLSDSGDSDFNSQTMPTFVSAPDAGNPETETRTPPPARQRPIAEENSDSQSISFEELFGPADESSISTPAATVPEVAEPTPAPAAAAEEEDSVEDALAAALSAMAAESPDVAPPVNPAEIEVPVQSSESLDDRTERMFNDQMEKARRAVSEKNWRQAVHVLSIASALHPEHEEAKQMLKDARAEKRKSEESV